MLDIEMAHAHKLKPHKLSNKHLTRKWMYNKVCALILTQCVVGDVSVGWLGWQCGRSLGESWHECAWNDYSATKQCFQCASIITLLSLPIWDSVTIQTTRVVTLMNPDYKPYYKALGVYFLGLHIIHLK